MLGYLLESVGSSGSGGWESAVSEIARDGVLEVQVQRSVGSLAKSLLHGKVVSIRCPGGVDSVISGNQLELESGWSWFCKSVSILHSQFMISA